MGDFITVKQAAEMLVAPTVEGLARMGQVTTWKRQLILASETLQIAPTRVYAQNAVPGGVEYLAPEDQRLVHVANLRRWTQEHGYELYEPARAAAPAESLNEEQAQLRREWGIADSEEKKRLCARLRGEVIQTTGKVYGARKAIADKLGIKSQSLEDYWPREGETDAPGNSAALDRVWHLTSAGSGRRGPRR